MLQISVFTGGIAQTNGYLVKTECGFIVIDAPEGMGQWLKDQGIDQLEALLLTHLHFDHCQDAARMQKAFQMPIYSYAEYHRDLTLEFLMGFSRGEAFSVEPFVTEHLLNGVASIEVAGLTWQLEHVPGHSVDSVTFYQAENHVLFSGDTLFAGGIGRTDFPNGSTAQLLSGIREKLFSLPHMTQVFPGHGPDTSIGVEMESNPFLV